MKPEELQACQQALMDFKQINGALVTEVDGERILQFLVDEKLPVSELAEGEVLPESYAGLKTKVVKGAPRKAEVSQAADYPVNPHRNTVVQPGISIGSEGLTGSAGLLVERNSEIFLLTNFHVCPVLEASVLQPGPLDAAQLGVPQYEIGKVRMNTISSLDMAMVKVNDGLRWSNVPVAKSQPIKGFTDPIIGQVYHKVGRTTGETRGKCISIGFIRVNYGADVGTRSIYVAEFGPIDPENPDNIEVSMGGDSGCAWFDPMTMEFVALHCAGENSGEPKDERGYGCPAKSVMQIYNTTVAEGGVGGSRVADALRALELAKSNMAAARTALDRIDQRFADIETNLKGN